MIDEDNEMGRIIGQKKEQAQADMQLSQQNINMLLAGETCSIKKTEGTWRVWGWDGP